MLVDITSSCFENQMRWVTCNTYFFICWFIWQVLSIIRNYYKVLLRLSIGTFEWHQPWQYKYVMGFGTANICIMIWYIMETISVLWKIICIPYYHAIMCLNWTITSFMLQASGWLWPSTGTLCHVYRVSLVNEYNDRGLVSCKDVKMHQQKRYVTPIVYTTELHLISIEHQYMVIGSIIPQNFTPNSVISVCQT